MIFLYFSFVSDPFYSTGVAGYIKRIRTKFPHCVGAIDGKNILLQCAVASASEYYNYKNTYSIVLSALVDSDYRFIFADIGSQGHDSGVFRNSFLWQKLAQIILNCHYHLLFQVQIKMCLMY